MHLDRVSFLQARKSNGILLLALTFVILFTWYVTIQLDFLASAWGANLLFSLFFIVSFLHIAKHDKLVAFFYLFLYIYTIFTQITYLIYPEQLDIISAGQYYGLEPYFHYLLFVGISFLAIYLLFLILHKIQGDKKDFLIVEYNRHSFGRRAIFLFLIAGHNILMLYFLSQSYGSLTYYSQDILKSNYLFFFGFYFYEITLILLYVKLKKFSPNVLEKSLYLILFLGSAAIFLTVSISSGQRGPLIALFLGFTTYYFLSKTSLLRQKLKAILVLLPVFFSVLLLSNIIRSLRGSSISIPDLGYALFSSPIDFLSTFLTLEGVLFQDYTGVSLTLLTSIQDQIVFPLEVLKSNIINSFVFMDYPSLGATLSRIVDPESWTGYGYYILAEGYNFMGPYGFVYNALVFVVGLSFWKRFISSNSRDFRNFMTAIVVMHVIDIVRGQSCMFIKTAYVAFIPAILLFCLANGARVKLNRKSKFS